MYDKVQHATYDATCTMWLQHNLRCHQASLPSKLQLLIEKSSARLSTDLRLTMLSAQPLTTDDPSTVPLERRVIHIAMAHRVLPFFS